jgi:hypothetical protein
VSGANRHDTATRVRTAAKYQLDPGGRRGHDLRWRPMNLSLPAVSDRLPFSDMPLFKASRLDEAHEQIAQLVNPHRITVLSNRDLLSVEFNGISEQDISLFSIQYGATVDVKPDESRAYFFVQTTVEGSSLILAAEVSMRRLKVTPLWCPPIDPIACVLPQAPNGWLWGYALPRWNATSRSCVAER